MKAGATLTKRKITNLMQGSGFVTVDWTGSISGGAISGASLGVSGVISGASLGVSGAISGASLGVSGDTQINGNIEILGKMIPTGGLSVSPLVAGSTKYLDINGFNQHPNTVGQTFGVGSYKFFAGGELNIYTKNSLGTGGRVDMSLYVNEVLREQIQMKTYHATPTFLYTLQLNAEDVVRISYYHAVANGVNYSSVYASFNCDLSASTPNIYDVQAMVASQDWATQFN